MESAEQEGVKPAVAGAFGRTAAITVAAAAVASGGSDGGGGGAGGVAVNKVRLLYLYFK